MFFWMVRLLAPGRASSSYGDPGVQKRSRRSTFVSRGCSFSQMDLLTRAIADTWRLLGEAARVLWFAVSLPYQLYKLLRPIQTRREGLGYAVWGAALLVFAVPEIWAAADGHKPWPTLSDTVGTIERHHDWTAILVVALLVFGVMHALRVKFSAQSSPVKPPSAKPAVAEYPGRHNAARDLLATEDGRLTRAEDLEYMGWWRYFVLAVALVVAGYVVPYSVDRGDKQLIGESLYGSIALALFLIPGWLSYRLGKFVPFPTLFQSFQDIEGRVKWLPVVIAAGLTVLMIHLVFYPWTSILPDLQHLHSYCQANKSSPFCKP
jgi:hypothetical protein